MKFSKYMIVISGLFLYLTAAQSGSLEDISARNAYTGIWHEPEFGEQTLFLADKGRCQFQRAGSVLFAYDICHWYADKNGGELTIEMGGLKNKVFMKLSGGDLLMARRRINLNSGSAETILKKYKKQADTAEKKEMKPFFGEWEALDHSLQLNFLSDGRCEFDKGSETVFNKNQCTWDAGSKGATLIFMVDRQSRRNAAMYVTIMGERLLVSTDKTKLLPRRADIQMVKKIQKY